MNEKELESHAKAFLRDNFDLSLDIPVRVSRRMKSKLGVFTVKYYGRKAYRDCRECRTAALYRRRHGHCLADSARKQSGDGFGSCAACTPDHGWA